MATRIVDATLADVVTTRPGWRLVDGNEHARYEPTHGDWFATVVAQPNPGHITKWQASIFVDGTVRYVRRCNEPITAVVYAERS